MPKALPKALAAPQVKQILRDSGANCGRGFALDSQMALSPLYARPRTSIPGGEMRAEEAYRAVTQPVALWYGTADTTVPIFTADWLAGLLPNHTKHYRDAGHGLILFSSKTSDKQGVGYIEEILDDLLSKMDVLP